MQAVVPGVAAVAMMMMVVMMVVTAAAPAHAAQLDAEILGDTVEPKFRFLRVVTIGHAEGGRLAELLHGIGPGVSFRLEPGDAGTAALVRTLGEGVARELSTAAVTGASLEYRASVSSHPGSTTIEYKIDLVPVMSGTASASIVDMQWRRFSITEPVLVPTPRGMYDINSPHSVLGALAPDASRMLMETAAWDVLSQPLLDASGLGTPMADWHFLFDPIGKLMPGMAVDTVVSQYSLGQCGIYDRQICRDRSWDAEVVLDKRYSVRATESMDDATVTLLGYTRVSDIRGIGYIERIPEAEAGPVEDLPVSMMYGMAAIAAVAGGSFFVISGRKSKRDSGAGQTGVDPADLVSRQTSAGAGGYHTNRGESVLRDAPARSAV